MPPPTSIRLGLARIAALVNPASYTWRAIHVAGTNGKGSICNYLTSALVAAGIRSGRFTSPHLVDRWDGITIDGATVAQSIFLEEEARVRARSQQAQVDASDFEILTATAFEIFQREKVHIGVVECGMGGLTDATNVLERPVVTVIANIGLDHQSFLGDTIEKIAWQKAGIVKEGAVCVVNGANPPSVLDVIGQVAAAQRVHVVTTAADASSRADLFTRLGLDRPKLEWAQQQNVQCAYDAFYHALPALRPLLPADRRADRSSTDEELALRFGAAMATTVVQGRYQQLDLSRLLGQPCSVLIDGAHNAQAWASLARHVDAHQRTTPDRGIVWVMAVSNGRPFDHMVDLLVRPHDSIVFTDFAPVEGMPWVKPVASTKLAAEVAALNKCRSVAHAPDVLSALQLAVKAHAGTPLVVAGSLYLVSDVFRLLQQ